MIDIAICDDDIDQIKNISTLVSKNMEALDISFKITHFDEGQDLIEYMSLAKESFDIIFLDIKNPCCARWGKVEDDQQTPNGDWTSSEPVGRKRGPPVKSKVTCKIPNGIVGISYERLSYVIPLGTT